GPSAARGRAGSARDGRAAGGGGRGAGGAAANRSGRGGGGRAGRGAGCGGGGGGGESGAGGLQAEISRPSPGRGGRGAPLEDPEDEPHADAQPLHRLGVGVDVRVQLLAAHGDGVEVGGCHPQVGEGGQQIG